MIVSRTSPQRKFFLYLAVSAALLASFLLAGCRSHADIPDDALFLRSVQIVSDNPTYNTSSVADYVRQHPRPKIFSVIPNVFARKVVYDSLHTHSSLDDIRQTMFNQGWLHADVKAVTKVDMRNVRLTYLLQPHESYYISSFDRQVTDTAVGHILDLNPQLFAEFAPGNPFSVSQLGTLRKSVTSLLNNSGYYRFNKEYLTFSIDTLANNFDVNIVMHVGGGPHPLYRIREVRFAAPDSMPLKIRRSVLLRNTAICAGDSYNASALQRTYGNFARLQALKYTNIKFTELPDTALLDCDVILSTGRPQTLAFMPEGTNTSGDFGAAATLTYEHRNLFHGSEVLSLQGRLAYEAIKGLEGYSDQNYFEYGVESKLLFPRLMAPLLSRAVRQNSQASTEFSVGYNVQNRPEFHRNVFSGAWRYKWTGSGCMSSYRFDLLDLNYIYMPWISSTFKQDYLDNTTNRNAILRYNYEDLFIMKTGISMNYRQSGLSLRTNLETSGNLLSAVASLSRFPKNSDNQYKVFNIAFAQYVKGDIDLSRTFDFDKRNQLAVHAAVGIAWPYGNSTILPFEKRYFSGGANSVRGWSVRTLGPGCFSGKDGRIDFINQTGDLKLDFSIEHRTQLFWKFSGAVFIDAGNIWTIRNYTDQPGGQFRFSEFYKQIAVSYGLGLRLNLGYFILRLDWGMKAINPAYETQRDHFPIYHPSLSRDAALHFAVGMPF